MTVEIVFETHSLTVDNEAGIATGWLPGELSAGGRRLALNLGERRRGDNITAVFASDLARAVETARISFADVDIPIFHDARLRECDYGSLNGMPATRLAAERGRHVDTPYPGGQNYRDVVAQVGEFLQDLARDWDGKRVLLIGHSATKWALDCLLNGGLLEELVDAPFDWQEGWLFSLPSGWTSGGKAR